MATGNTDEGGATEIVHTNIFSDGSYPPPIVNVAKQLTITENTAQLTQATQFYEFLDISTSNLLVMM